MLEHYLHNANEETAADLTTIYFSQDINEGIRTIKIYLRKSYNSANAMYVTQDEDIETSYVRHTTPKSLLASKPCYLLNQQLL